MLNLRRIAVGSLNLWKREMKIAAPTRMSAPFSTGGDGASKEKRQREKNDIFEKLQSLTGETLDLIMREQNKKGLSVTKADLVSWAKRLDEDGKYEYALEIFEWMDKKKMKFTPSQLALFVDLLGRIKGFESAREYLKKVHPDLNHDAKNWPAFANLMYWRGKQSGPPRITLPYLRGKQSEPPRITLPYLRGKQSRVPRPRLTLPYVKQRVPKSRVTLPYVIQWVPTAEVTHPCGRGKQSRELRPPIHDLILIHKQHSGVRRRWPPSRDLFLQTGIPRPPIWALIENFRVPRPPKTLRRLEKEGHQ